MRFKQASNNVKKFVDQLTGPVQKLLNFLKGVRFSDADAELRPKPKRCNRAVFVVKLKFKVML